MVRGEAISARTRHGGFSLVELLVVIAIIGVMTGVLLPAVQNAREAARRSECVNRLRQIGLALHNFESAREHLPSGSMAKALPQSPASPHTFFRWSALAQAMPYMERGTIYGELDLEAPLYRGDFKVSAENAEIVRLMIPDFLCPTDRGDRVSSAFGPTNYAMCAGTGADGGTPFNADGAFYINSATRFADLADGLSNTALIAEGVLGETPPPLTPRSAVDPQLVYAFGQGAPLTAVGCERSAVWNLSDPPGFAWANGEYRSAMYNHWTTPNSREIDCIAAVTIAPPEEKYAAYGWRTARSSHPGGVNVALADGSASFVADDVAVEVWRALATRSGGE
jgi:prepilin-type N-terminal cleavage/methylation domain-containing protein/prepilin-type processing-associated H-X9-DG protein